MSDLLYSLGLDITDFKTSVQATKAQADEVKRSFRGFKEVLGAGGVAFAVLGFFKSVIDHAQQAKGEIDSSTQAVKDFGDGLDSIKEGAMRAGTVFLGTFNKLGEAIGAAIKIGLDGWSAWADGEDKLESTSKALAETEKEIAEQRKLHGDEYKRITTELANIEKQRQELANQGLTTEETYNILAAKLVDAQIQQGLAAGDTYESRKATLAVAQAELALAKTQQQLDKEAFAANEKARQKAAADAAAAEEKLRSEKAETAALVIKYQEEDAAAALKKLDVDKQIALLSQQKKDTEQVIAGYAGEEAGKREEITKLRQIDNDLADAKLEKEKQISAEIENQAAAEKKVAAEKKLASQDTPGFETDGSLITYNNAADQRIYEQRLRDSTTESIDRLIAALRLENQKLTDSGASIGSSVRARNDASIATLQQRRSNVNSFLFDPNYSDALGKGVAAAQLGQQQIDESKAQTNLLQEITDRLSGKKPIGGSTTG